jgi:molybdopterin-binding protein
VIIEIPSTGERVEAHIVEDERAAPLAVTFGSTGCARYMLAPMVDNGWRVVEAPPRERAVLAAHGIMGSGAVTSESPAAPVAPDAVVVASRARLVVNTAPRERSPMTLSARNQLSGTVRSVRLGTIMAEVVVDIAGLEIVSVITRSSAEKLNLTPGSPVVVIIKATEVMLATE